MRRLPLLVSFLLLACSPRVGPIEPTGLQSTECEELDLDGDGVSECTDICDQGAEDHDGYLDSDGCPDPDNDQDGIPDERDCCPCLGEDVDDFQDEDGCPDPDNDQDGFPDLCDACPFDAERYQGHLDTDGCPDILPQEDRPDPIHLAEHVHFSPQSAEPRDEDFELLRRIANILRTHPEILTLEVSGHADSAEGNATLIATQRADAVVARLATLGIDRGRLDARGYADRRPAATNETREGRAENRRVEMRVLRLAEEAEAPTSPPAGTTVTMDRCPDGPPPGPRDVCEEARSQLAREAEQARRAQQTGCADGRK